VRSKPPGDPPTSSISLVYCFPGKKFADVPQSSSSAEAVGPEEHKELLLDTQNGAPEERRRRP
ncbi:hypothetical protein JTE90_008361, partial [Oedothorax gibbosus]